MKAVVELSPTIKLEIDDRDDLETLHKAIVFGNPRRKCNACGEIIKYLTFITNKDKEGNTYIKNLCRCGATSRLGQYKTGGYFWKEFELYDPNNKD